MAELDNNMNPTPIKIVRTLDNCYPGSRGVLDSITAELNPRLGAELRTQRYGESLRQIVINTAMSFYDDYHCKTNYIILDEGLKLRQSEYYDVLLTMFPEDEIERDGLFLRPRYQIGPLRKDTGIVYATIVFEKAFSFMPEKKQKEIMSRYFLTTVNRIARRKKAAPDYDFEQLLADFERVLNWWINL